MQNIDDDFDKTAKKLTEDIQNMENYKSLYKELQVIIYSLFFVYKFIFVTYFIETGSIEISAKGRFQKFIIRCNKSEWTRIRNTKYSFPLGTG